MAFVINDRVKETTSSTGTTTVTLTGAQTGFQSFSSGIGASNSTYYTIALGNQWEVGIGSLTNATTFTRDSVITSSNSNTLVNFSAGIKDIFCSLPAEYTPSPSMLAQAFVNTHATTITQDQTIESGVLAGPVSITGTQTVTGSLVVV
jgi:hypothetical protein